MNKKRMNKIIKFFIISITAIALVLSGRPPTMVDAAQPGTPSGVGTFKPSSSESAVAYDIIGYSLMYSGYTTSAANGDSAVKRHTYTSSRHYSHDFRIVNDGGTLRYLRGSRYVPKAGGGWHWINQEVAVTPANFNRNNLVRGRSLLDNMYLESNVNRNTLDRNLVNGGTAWLNAIMAVRTTARNYYPTMYTGRLWGGGKGNFSEPYRTFTRSAGVVNSALWGWAAGTVPAINSHFDISVSMPKIDDTPPAITISPNSDGTWRNTNRTVTATATDAGSGVKRMRWRIERNGSWGGWSHWQSVSSLNVNLTNTGKQRVQIQAQDNFNNTGNKTSGYFHIDKTAPGGSISASPTSWTNGNVTLTFNGTDTGGSGVRRVRQSGGSWVNGSRTTRTVTSNGTYSFEVQDNAGNTKTVSRAVTNIDKTTPNANSPTILNARYTNGNDYWVRPGDSVVIRTSGFDDESRMRNSNLRLYGNGNDNRAEYQWYARPTSVREYQTTGGYTSITGGSENYWGWTAIYNFNVRANTNAGNRLFNVHTYHRDNANNNTGFVDSGLNLRTDATAPTITANTTSRGWGNSNVTVTLTHADGQSGIATRQYAWSTSTSTPSSWTNYSSAVTQSTQGTWYLHARAVDNVGRVTTQRFGPYRIDKTAPNGTISGNPTSWTNQNVTLTFNATDTGGSGVRRVRRPNGTWVNGATTNQTVTSNGTYTFRVEDNAGNIRDVSATVNRIDKTLPNGTISQSPTAWTNGNVTLSFSATDSGGSGVKRVRRPNGTWVNGSSTSQAVTANGTYTFVVEDNAGNVRSVSRTVSNIDKTLPNATFSPNSASWQNTNRAVTVTATDTGGSGYKRLRTRVETNGTWGAWSAWQTGATKSLTASTNGKTRFQVEVEDNAGNKRTVTSGTYHIDKTLPNATFSPNSASWRNSNLAVTVTATDTGGSGYKQLRTRVETNGTWGAWSGWTTSSTKSLTASTEGKTRFQVQVQDNAGNSRTVTSGTYHIDKTLPNATFSPNSASWQNTNRAVTVTATDSGGSGYKQLRTRVETNGTWGGWSGWTTSSTKSLTASTNGKTRFQVQVQDNAGNTRTVTSGTYHIDKTLPNATFSPNSASWQNSNRAVTVTATDSGGSGFKQLRTRVETNGTWGGWSGWQTGSTKSLTASANGKTRFQVEVHDNAGNTRTVTSGTYHIDKVVPTVNAPVIHDARYVSGNNYWFRPGDNLRVDISGTDAHSGITYSYLRLYTSGSDNRGIYRWGTSTFEQFMTATYSTISQGSVLENGTTKRYRFNANVKSNSDNQDLSVYSYFTDVAGNVIGYIDSGRRVRVDGTAPTVSASPSSRAWGNTNANVTLTYSDSRSGVQTRQYAWSTSTATPSSWNNYTGQVSQANDGVWYLHYRTVDNVGNVRTGRFGPYRVDKTVPNASSTQSPTAWTKGNVNITWTASATGSPLSRIRTHNGSAWGAWSAVSGTSSSTVQTVTSNGTYHFQVQDAAGNVRQISRTVSNIDKTLPNMTVTSLNTDWTNRSIGIRTTVNDRGDTGESQHISGVQRIRMRPQGGTWGAWRTFSSTSERSSANLNDTWTIDENGTYEWEVEDRAGNKKTQSYTVTNIDLIPPATSGSFTPDGWTNQTITITWLADRNGNPGSPLDAYRYDRGNGDWTGWQNATHADAFTVTQDVTENGTYQFDIRDKAGNVARSSVTVTKHDIVLPAGQITARFDRSERDDHVGYTSNDLVDMIDSNRVTVDVTGVEDLGISGVDFVTIEEQRRIGYGSNWMTVREIDYDWPDPYNTTSQTYDIDVAHAQDTRFILTVTDRAGNESSRVASNVVRQSVLQFIDFRITDVVNPNLSEEELAAIRASDFEDVVELTAGTNVTFDVTYQLRHLDTVDELSGEITIKTISDDRTDTHTIEVNEDETGHNQHVTFTKTFTVPQGAPKGSEITIGGNLEAKLANGTTHEITYPSENDQGTDTLGEIGSHIEEFFRFRIVR